MTNDPQVRALLDETAAAGAKPFEDLSVGEARQSAWDFIALQGEAEDVVRIEHRFVPGPTADLPVRIYYPDGEGPFPALVYFHGSGWVIANIEVCDTSARSIAKNTGCVVIAVNYQKAPEHKFPTAADDAWAATTWVFDNTDELGIDPTRIGVIGDSAGGNLAAVTALRARDESGPRLKCQILIYPVTDADTNKPSYLENANGYLLQRGSMEWFFDHYLNDRSEEDDPRVSPLRAPDHSDLPPTFIATAGFDPLRDDGRLYADKLRAAGNQVRYVEYPDAIHAFFWMQGTLDVAKNLHKDVADEVRKLMV